MKICKLLGATIIVTGALAVTAGGVALYNLFSEDEKRGPQAVIDEGKELESKTSSNSCCKDCE
ncbi:MAG: hypothetical protein R3Y52_04030 [Psittacicella sp.]